MFIVIFAIVYFISSIIFLCPDCIRINFRACKTKKYSRGGPPDPRTNVRGAYSYLRPQAPHLSIPSYATARCFVTYTIISILLFVITLPDDYYAVLNFVQSQNKFWLLYRTPKTVYIRCFVTYTVISILLFVITLPDDYLYYILRNQ